MSIEFKPFDTTNDKRKLHEFRWHLKPVKPKRTSLVILLLNITWLDNNVIIVKNTLKIQNW